MDEYAVHLHVSNLLLRASDGSLQKGGLHTWRFVEAETGELAVASAINALRKDQMFVEEVNNSPNDPPHFEVEEIEDLGDDEELEDIGTALIFYIDPDEQSSA